MSHTLYRPLLDRSPVLQPELLRAAHRHAAEIGDIDFLAVMAARFDLPDDVLDQLGQHPAPAVVAAFRGRATIPGRARDRAPETRSSVLAKAVGAYGTPGAAAFEDAISAYVAKPTATLLKVLMARPATWYTAKQAAALLLGAQRWEAEHRGGELTRNLCARLGPYEATLLAPQVTSHSLATELLRFDLPAATAATVIGAVIHGDDRLTYGQAIISHAMSYRASQEERNALVEAFPRDRGGLRRLAEAAARYRSTTYTYFAWDLTDTVCPKMVESLDDASEDVLLAAAASNDTGLITRVVDRLCGLSDRLFANVSLVLLRNPALTEADRHRLMLHVRTAYAPSDYQLRDLGKLDVLAMWPDDPIVADAWCHQFTARVLRRNGWEPFGGRACAGDVLVDLEAQHLAGKRDWQIQEVLHAAAAVGIDDEHLSRVRHQLLKDALERRDDKGVSLLGDQIARVVVGRLGADPRRWTTYESLSEGFTGSFGELLDTVDDLAS